MRDEWSDPERVAEYLAREIPHRDVAEAMLLEALPARIERFADLGTGDGRLLALVRERHPEAYGIGVDVSRPMLDRAAARFAGQPLVELREHDLARPLIAIAPGAPEASRSAGSPTASTATGSLATRGPFDAIVSALAIHHVENVRKRTLFEEVHALLAPGGVFVNLELVAVATPGLHERFRRAIGRERDDPADRLADLCAQLAWLREAGFAEVDCHFKWLELALIVAVRGT